MRRPYIFGGRPSPYDAGVRCQYINGPVGRPFSTEPAMTIHRNPVDAPYTQPFRSYVYPSNKVPYEPLLGLGCWREPAVSPSDIACQLRRNFF